MKLTDKIFSGKTLAILTGGGDTPALNSSIESIRNRAQILGFKVYGIRKGWKGLLGDGDIVDLTNMPFDGMFGGTALGSSRTNPLPSKKNPEDRIPQVLKNLERYKIDVVVTIGGDDTNGAAKGIYEREGIPVIGFPKTIDNDLRTGTMHNYNGKEIEAVICPGFPTAFKSVQDFAARLRTTCDSHQRIAVLEIMGRDAGWLNGGALFGGAEISLVPEFEMTKDRKEQFLEKVKEAYTNSSKKSLIIAVSEGVRWWDDEKQKTDVVYASSETDEYGHARFGGISGVIASEISNKLKIEARGQIAGYHSRSGECGAYDRRLTQTLADKAMDLLIRGDYGRMPVMAKVVECGLLEEFNTSSIEMGNIGNRPLADEYYDINKFNFTDAFVDFGQNIIGKPYRPEFKYDFPVVKL